MIATAKNFIRAFPISTQRALRCGFGVLTYYMYAARTSPCVPTLHEKRKRSASMLLALLMFCTALPLRAIAGDEGEKPLPVPRFVSLRSGEVNMRVGPGTRYSINWVYHREGLPVEIIEEFDQWRKIRDSEGTVGWVHKQMVQGKRTAMITGKQAVLRRSPDAASRPALRAQPGVIGRVLTCEKEWCKLQITGHKAWIQKTAIFGVFPREEF